jgi:hypothetical protein
VAADQFKRPDMDVVGSVDHPSTLLAAILNRSRSRRGSTCGNFAAEKVCPLRRKSRPLSQNTAVS